MIHLLLNKNKFTLSDSTVVNEGVGGNNTQDIINRQFDVLQNDPDLTILMVGTNDMLNSGSLISLNDYETNLGTIVDYFTDGESDVLLMTIPPCIESYVNDRHTYPDSYPYDSLTLNEIIELSNEKVFDVSQSKGVLYLDVYSLFYGNVSLEPDSLIRNQANAGTEDGVHPTPGGYTVIANEVYNYLTRKRKNYNTIVCLGDSITYGANVSGAGTSLPTAETYPGQFKNLIS